MKFYKIDYVWLKYNDKTKEILLRLDLLEESNAVIKNCNIDDFITKLYDKNAKEWSWDYSSNRSYPKLKVFLKNYK